MNWKQIVLFSLTFPLLLLASAFPAAAIEVRVHYQADWPQANIHYNNGSGWTEAPGESMEAYRSGWFRRTVERSGDSLTFVFNDGSDSWDNNGGSDYSSSLTNLWVSGGQILDSDPGPQGGQTVTFDPATPVAGQPLTITYTGILRNAAQVVLHWGYDGWQGVQDSPMQQQGDTWTVTVTVPAAATTSLECVFHDGDNIWDNNSGQDYGAALGSWNPDQTPPRIAITTPLPGSILVGSVTLTADASDNVGVSRVVFYQGTNLLQTVTTVPYSYAWDSRAMANGPLSLQALAFDAAGNSSSATVQAVVSNDITAPTVSFSLDQDPAALQGTVQVAVSAADDRAVTRVELQVDGSLLQSREGAPWDFSLDTGGLANGAHRITVIASDAAGNSARHFLDVTVDNGDAPQARSIRLKSTVPARNCFIQYRQPGGQFNPYPGEKMTAGTNGWWQWQKALDANELEVRFLFSSGRWDNNRGANYRVLPAQAWVKDGRVFASDPEQDSEAPQVSLQSPTNSEVVSGQVTVAAAASDNLGVHEVRFLLDGSLIHSAHSAPYTFTWNSEAAANGSHLLQAIALDVAGNSNASRVSLMVSNQLVGVKRVHYKSDWSSVNIHYNNGSGWTTVPGEAMESEGNNWFVKTVTASGELTMCFNNGSSWDNNGGRDYATSLSEVWIKDRQIYEGNPDDEVPPEVSWLAPAAGSNLEGIVTLSAQASDNQKLVKVEFYDGALLIGSSEQAPYHLQWNTTVVPNGTHSLKAVAWDEAGNTNATAPVTVTTSNPNLPPVADAGRDINTIKGATVTFNAGASHDPNGTIVSYSWDNGMSGKTPSTSFNELGTFTITLTVTDNEGATDTDSVTVTVSTNIPRPQRTDFREETIYFLMTARFYDGDPANTRPSPCYETSGNKANNDPSWRGDFKGLIEKLDYIKALGFSAIWITPPVLNRNYYDYHGYHAWDLNRIDGRLTSPAAGYQDLINECHKRGLKVIQDIVLNHSGRYGFKGQCEIKYWGDRDDPEWGKDSEINYYDEYNPDFEYDGVSIEPKSGKSWYNGDLWQKEKPNLPWQPVDEYYWWNGETHSHQNDLDNLWGVHSPYSSPEGYRIWHFQWPGMYESQFTLLNPEWYHCFWLKNWEDYSCQYGTIHEDCLDLNTESQVVQQYLINAYSRYIHMGVDAFRIDTVKHISRNTFNRRFNPAFHTAASNAGNDHFYMFGEVCVRDHGVWNKGNPALSVPFYTWKERTTYSENDKDAAWEAYQYETGRGSHDQPTSMNHLLDGNNYRTPDYSRHSGLNVIDFRMHWNFASASTAFGIRDGDQYMNDATWNVTYVESHDYSPLEVGNSLYARMTDQDTMAENWSLMFTWRGIPCIFYGNEIMFKAGKVIDEGPNRALEDSGRAYFGPHLEGSVQVQDFARWTSATGEMATTLNHPLAKHVQRLNLIRRAIPALQKGQYSTQGVSGNIAFKRRYTRGGVDSFCLVTVSGDATFSGIPNGTYVDAVTGNSKTVSNGSLSISCSGKGNIRVYVLNLPGNPAPGQIGEAGMYIK